MTRWLLVLLLLAPALSAQGGPSSATPDAARLDAARQVLNASGAAEAMVNSMKASLPAQRAATPQLPAEFWTRFEQRIVKDAPQLVDSIAVLYASTFSLAELQELSAFHRSPIGQRLRAVQNELLAGSTAIGQRWGMRIGAEVGASLTP